MKVVLPARDSPTTSSFMWLQGGCAATRGAGAKASWMLAAKLAVACGVNV